jgi:hypothetical protein
MHIRFPSASFEAVLVTRKKSTKLRVLDSIHLSVTVWNVNESIEKVGVGAWGTRSTHFCAPDA